MNQIVIPGLHKMHAMQNRYLRMLGVKPDPADDFKRPAIEGKIVDYAKLLTGTNRTFVKGCFNLSKRIPLCIDHNDKTEYADTDNGVTIVDADDGLLFRVDLARTKNPTALASIIDSKNRRAVSISVNILASEKHLCAGKEIEFITKADIREFSLVKAGKSPQAFAFITDAATQPAPTAKSRSLDHTLSSANFRVDKVVASIERTNAAPVEPLTTEPYRYEPKQVGVSANGRRIYE